MSAAIRNSSAAARSTSVAPAGTTIVSANAAFIAASPTNEGFVRFRLNSASWTIVSYPGHNLQDGLWHHWAMVYKNGTMTCYGDRVYSNSAAMSFSAAKDAVMELGHKVLRGYVSCLRVTKRALTTDGFIYATECPTCLPADPRTASPMLLKVWIPAMEKGIAADWEASQQVAARDACRQLQRFAPDNEVARDYLAKYEAWQEAARKKKASDGEQPESEKSKN